MTGVILPSRRYVLLIEGEIVGQYFYRGGHLSVIFEEIGVNIRRKIDGRALMYSRNKICPSRDPRETPRS